MDYLETVFFVWIKVWTVDRVGGRAMLKNLYIGACLKRVRLRQSFSPSISTNWSFYGLPVVENAYCLKIYYPILILLLYSMLIFYSSNREIHFKNTWYSLLKQYVKKITKCCPLLMILMTVFNYNIIYLF